MKVNIKVFDSEGNDVTNKDCWYLDTDGNLCREVNDIDFPVCEVLPEEGFTYEITLKN